MLRFFRRIRKTLTKKGNLKGYILYALGEILLIVIGILIAMQISNRNELNKENATGINYLNRIQADLEKDLVYLEKKVLFSIEEQKLFRTYIHSMYEEQSTEEEFISLTSPLGWDAENLILEDKTYVEITSSGQFKFISNEVLRGQIMDYYKSYAVMYDHISEMNQTGITLFNDIYKLIIKYFDVVNPLFNKDYMRKETDWEFINDSSSPEFRDLEACATFYFFKQTVFENYYKELSAKASGLIEKIETETNH